MKQAIHRSSLPATTILVLAGLALCHCGVARAQGDSNWPPVTKEEAIRTARALVARQSGAGAGRLGLCYLECSPGLPYAAEWTATFETPDGDNWTVGVDGVSGSITLWQRFPLSHNTDSSTSPSPRVSPEEASAIARRFVEDYPGLLTDTPLRAYDEPPLECQHWYAIGWVHVLDPWSGCIGPVDAGVFVDHQTGEVLGMQIPWRGPLLVPTRPAVNQSQAVRIARWYAPLDPERYGFNRAILRLAVDGHGVQRLTWECCQLPEPGSFMFGVVVDAQSGAPLRLNVPFGATKFAMRKVKLPARASVRLEPGGRPMTTQLAPPVFRADGLWVRAEHLRAVDGVRVEADRSAVTARLGDIVLKGKQLRAEWRDYGWWVPLRHVAKLLGWRVDWNNAKKEATIRTAG